MRNLHLKFVLCSNGQIYGGDFTENMNFTKLSNNQAKNYVLVMIDQTMKEILNFQQLKNRTDYEFTIEF